MSRTCEAQAMDFGRFGHVEGTVPPCGDPGTEQVEGYWLCAGCAETLRTIGKLAMRIAKENDITLPARPEIPEEPGT